MFLVFLFCLLNFRERICTKINDLFYAFLKCSWFLRARRISQNVSSCKFHETPLDESVFEIDVLVWFKGWDWKQPAHRHSDWGDVPENSWNCLDKPISVHQKWCMFPCILTRFWVQLWNISWGDLLCENDFPYTKTPKVFHQLIKVCGFSLFGGWFLFAKLSEISPLPFPSDFRIFSVLIFMIFNSFVKSRKGTQKCKKSLFRWSILVAET